MTVLAPWALAVGGLALAVVGALHLITVRRPPELALPTARFVPPGEARARSRARRPADPWLLLWRLLALALATLALAGLRPDAGIRRVIVLDQSRTADPVPLTARANARFRDGDVVVAFDTGVRIGARVPAPRSAAPALGAGSLAVGLAAAHAEGARLRAAGAQVELLVVASLAAETVDDAARTLLDAWPGPVQVITFAPVTPRLPPAVVRAAGAGGGAGGGAAPRAVVVDGGTVIAPFARVPVGPGRVVARWEDGTPAAVERVTGDGCVREVGVGIPDEGDIRSRPAVRRLDALLTGPCGAPVRAAAVPLVASSRRPSPVVSAADALALPWARWLLGAALLLLLGEPLVRRARVG